MTERPSYEEFCRAVGVRQQQHPEWRYGQTVFNVLYWDGFDPEFADEIRGTDLDPFHKDARTDALFQVLEERWRA